MRSDFRCLKGNESGKERESLNIGALFHKNSAGGDEIWA